LGAINYIAAEIILRREQGEVHVGRVDR
jgi:hypothetical protein